MEKLTNREQQIALLLAKGIVVVLAIFAYIVRAIFKALYKLKRWLFRLAIIILLTNSALTAFQQVAYAPKANASEFRAVAKPLTEKEQIVNFIYEVFGKDAKEALMIAKCESGLRPTAFNDNTTWGGVGQDLGIFQINNKYQLVTNKTFLYDWKINILMAKQIFDGRGNWSAWSCARHLGI